MRATKRGSGGKAMTGSRRARTLRPGCGPTRLWQRLLNFTVAVLMLTQPAPGGFLWKLDLVAWAAVPWMINYQGRLTDSGNEAVTGTFAMTFRLYDDPTAGAEQWEEEQTVSLTQGDNGIFSVVLGSVTGLWGVSFNSPLWLSVQVNDDPEMTPRQRLTATGYAMNADQVDSLNSSQFMRTDVDTSTSGKLTITRSGLALLVQPATDPAANTNLVEVKNAAGSSRFTVDLEGDVVVAGDLTVSGTIGGATASTGTTNPSWTVGSTTDATANDLSVLFGQTGQESLVFDGNGIDDFSLSDDLRLSTRSALRLEDDAGGDAVSLVAPIGVTSYTLTLPAAVGAADQVLTTDASGNLTWADDDNAGGTVTSVALSMPAEFSVANSPVTTSGILTVTKATQAANALYAGPVSGAAAAPGFRTLVDDDVPDTVSLDWAGLQAYPAGCGAGQVVQAVGDTLTCVSVNTDTSITLQDAYDLGNAITTTSNRNIAILLDDSAVDSDFLINMAGTGNVVEVQDAGTAVFRVADGGAALFQTATDAVAGVQVLDADGGVPVLSIDTVNERVGIGEATPLQDLHIQGANTGGIRIETPLGGSQGRIDFYNSGNRHGTISSENNASAGMLLDQYTGPIRFMIDNDTKMIVATNGSIGINNFNPTERLHLVGGLRLGEAPAAVTLLNGGINAVDTTVTVDDTTGYPTAGTLLIDGETMTYTGTTATTFTGVTRGALGTVAAVHADNAPVTVYLMAAVASATNPKMVLTGAGNLGLGVLDPDEQLELAGRLHLNPVAAPADTTGKLYNIGGALYWDGIDLTGFSTNPSFASISSGVNTGAGMEVGTGASLYASGTGIVRATDLQAASSVVADAEVDDNITLGATASVDAAAINSGTLDNARLNANVSLLGQTIGDAEVDDTITLTNLTQISTRSFADLQATCADGQVVGGNAAGTGLECQADQNSGGTVTAVTGTAPIASSGGNTPAISLNADGVTAAHLADNLDLAAAGETTLTITGNAVVQSSTDSATGVQVLDQDGGIPVLNIDTLNERVGIGTSAPGDKLHVVGGNVFMEHGRSVRFEQTIAGQTGATIYSSASNALTLQVDRANEGMDFRLNTTGNGVQTVMKVTGSIDGPADGGRVGIGLGTFSPVTKLDVLGSTRVRGSATSVLTGSIDPDGDTSVTGVGTRFTTQLVLGDRITVSGETRTVTAITDDNNLTVASAFTDTANDTSPDRVPAEFSVRDVSGNVDLVVQDTGNIGLGVLEPDEQLHLLGRMHLNPTTAPVDTTDKLYNVGGALYWDGIDLTGFSTNPSFASISSGVNNSAGMEVGTGASLYPSGTGIVRANDVVSSSSVIADAEVDDDITLSAAASVDAAAIDSGTLNNARLDASVSLLGQTIADAEVDDTISIANTGSVHWAALNNYPAACSAGQVIQAVGDTLTCVAVNTDTSITLQDAYDLGNAITTSDNRNVTVSLADTATDADFIVDLLGTGNSFEVRDSGLPTFVVSDYGQVAFRNTVDSSEMLEVYDADAGIPIMKVNSVYETVGIRQSLPVTALDVAGSARVQGSATSALTGSIDPDGDTTVTGVGTFFTRELVPGDRITVSGETRTVTAVTNDTALTVSPAFTDTANDLTPDRLAAELTVQDSAGNLDLVVQDNGNVGIGSPVPTNRLQVAGDSALFESAGDMRVYVSKNAAANTGTVIFQDNYSARAEIGLAGDDKFHVKVSPDGSAWFDGLTIDQTNGNMGLGVTDPDEQLELTGRMHLGATTAPVDTTDKLYNVGGALYWDGIDLTGFSTNPSFASISSGVNNSAGMEVGTGASLYPSGTGIVRANDVVSASAVVNDTEVDNNITIASTSGGLFAPTTDASPLTLRRGTDTAPAADLLSIRNAANSVDLFTVNASGSLTAGTVPWARISGFGGDTTPDTIADDGFIALGTETSGTYDATGDTIADDGAISDAEVDDNLTISGGTVNNSVIGGVAPAAATVTSLTAIGNTVLGDNSTDTVVLDSEAAGNNAVADAPQLLLRGSYDSDVTGAVTLADYDLAFVHNLTAAGATPAGQLEVNFGGGAAELTLTNTGSLSLGDASTDLLLLDTAVPTNNVLNPSSLLRFLSRYDSDAGAGTTTASRPLDLLHTVTNQAGASRFDLDFGSDGADFSITNSGAVTAGAWQATTIGVGYGGTGLTAALDDRLMVGDGSAWVSSPMPTGGTLGCSGVNDKLLYNTTTNSFVCGSDAGAAGLGDNVQVAGASASDANFVDAASTGTAAGVDFVLNTTPNPDEISATVAAASATDAGVVTTGTQTLAGSKTFTGNATVFQNSADSTTGLQVLDADGGVPVLNVDTQNERIGIGTAAPGHALHIINPASATVRTASFGMNSGVTDTEYPVAQFDVAGTGAQLPAVLLSSNGTAGLKLTHENTFYDAVVDHNFSAAQALHLAVRGTKHLSVLDGGNVGIGTTAPTARMHARAMSAGSGTGTLSGGLAVNGSSSTFTSQLRPGDIITAAGQTRTVASVDSDTLLTVTSAFSPVLSGDAFTYQQPVARFADGSGATQALVTANGSVGIGTTGPNEKLTVEGPISVREQASAPGLTTNYGKLYAKNDSKIYFLNDNGVEYDLTAASNGISWSLLTNPSGSLNLSMADNSTTFTYNNATSTANLFNLTDTASNSGTGYLLNVTTATSSNVKPLHVSAGGNEAITVLANGFVGMGVVDPDEQLEIAGRLHLGATSAPSTTAEKLYNVGGTLFWNGVDISTAPAADTLQTAYGAGNTITTTDGRNLGITLADTTTDSDFLINMLGAGNVVEVQDAGTPVFHIADEGAALFQTKTDSATGFQILDQNGGNPVMVVDTASERIGVGITPDVPVHIRTDGTGYALKLDENSGGEYWSLGTGSTGDLLFNNLQTRVTFADSGDLIVGTSTNAGAIQVNQSTTTGNVALEGLRLIAQDSNSSASNGMGAYLSYSLETNNNGSMADAARIEAVLDDSTDAARDSSIRLYTLGPNAGSSTTPTEKLRLTSAGYLGVNTPAPASALHVAGALIVHGDSLVDADGSATAASGTPETTAEGVVLVAVEAADALCTDSLTTPLNVRLDADCSTTGDGTLLRGSLSSGTVQVTSAWAFRDTGTVNGAYNDGEDLYIDTAPLAQYDSSNVGIGTATPDKLLTIAPAANRRAELALKSTSGAGGLISFAGNSGYQAGIGWNQAVSGALEFRAGGDPTNSANTRLIILPTGEIGLGLQDPDEQLELTGRLHLGQTTAPSTTTDKLYNVGGALYWDGIDLTGFSTNPSFASISSGVNNSAGMEVGTGASLYASGTGIVRANDVVSASSVIADAEVDDNITLTNLTQISTRSFAALQATCTDGQVVGGNAAGTGLECQTDQNSGGTVTSVTGTAPIASSGGNTPAISLNADGVTAAHLADTLDLAAAGETTLTITGNAVVQSSTDSTSGLQVMDADGGNPVLNVDTVNERVGIGTGAPAHRVQIDGGSLSINGSSANGGQLFIDVNEAGIIGGARRQNEGGLLLGWNLRGQPGSDSFYTHLTHGSTGYSGIELGHGGAIRAYTAGGATTAGTVVTPTERLTIASNGNVGIGETSPVMKLEVDGSTLVRGTATSVLTGSIDPDGQVSVEGVGTAFESQLAVGDQITVSGETRTVTWITDDLNLTVDSAFSNNANDTSVDRLPAVLIVKDAGDSLQLLMNEAGNVAVGTHVTNQAKLRVENSDTGLAGGQFLNFASSYNNTGVVSAQQETVESNTSIAFHARNRSTDTENSHLFLGEDGSVTRFAVTTGGHVNLGQTSAPSTTTDKLYNVGGTLYWAGSALTTSSGSTLQAAYAAGNTVTTTDGRNIAFTLDDTTTDSNFIVNMAGLDSIVQFQSVGIPVYTVGNGGAVTHAPSYAVAGHVINANLSGLGSRTLDVMAINQPNHATGNSTANLLELNNADLASSGDLLNIVQSGTGKLITAVDGATEVFGISDGGAAAFKTTTDAVTGLQVLDADGGLPVLNIDTLNEFVGIGVSNPGHSLHVETTTGTGTNDAGMFVKNVRTGASGAHYGVISYAESATAGATNVAGFFSASTPGSGGRGHGLVVAAGNTGLGTSTPVTALDVNGSTRLKGSATSVLTGSIDPASSTTVTGVGTYFTSQLVPGDRITVSGETRTVVAIASDTSLTVDSAFSNNANDTTPDRLPAEFILKDSADAIHLIVNDVGNVGIKTATPQWPLQISLGQDSTTRADLVNPTDGVNAAAVWAVGSATATGGLSAQAASFTGGGASAHFADRISLLADSSATGLDLASTAASGDLRVYTGGQATTNERMRIDSTGNVNILAQGDLRLQDDTGGQYVALQAATGTSNHTLTLPANNGTGVLTNDGSGGLSWGAGASTTTLQQAYGNDVDGTDSILALTNNDDSLIFRNPAASGTDSGDLLSIDQLATGAVGGLMINQAGTAEALEVYSNVGAAVTGSLVYLRVDDPAFDQYALSIRNDGANNALNIDQSTTGIASGLNVYSNVNATAAWPLVSIHGDDPAFDVAALAVRQDGTGDLLRLDDDATTVARIADNGVATFQTKTDSATGFQVLDADGGSPVLNIDTVNERVGLGSASPPDQLYVFNAPASYVTVGQDGLSGSGTTGLRLLTRGTSTTTLGNAATQGWELGARSDIWGNAEQDDLVISHWNGSAWTGKMLMDAGTGNIGIGMNAPIAKLDVSGSARVQAGAPSVLTGSIDPDGDTSVTGVGTQFLTQLVPGDQIVVSGETRSVTAIASNTSLTVDLAFADNANDTGVDRLPAAFVIDDGAGNFIASIDGNGALSHLATLSTTNSDEYGSATAVMASTAAPSNSKTGIAGSVTAGHAAGSMGGIIGVSGSAAKGGTGAVASAVGLYAQVGNANATGAITDAYGVFIGDSQETGTITNDWGLYQVDTGALNYFGGNLGIGAAPTNNKLQVMGTTALFESAGDFRLNISKNAAGNTGSLVFQDNYSGRAEIGLTGDDKLHMKVSSNGSSWTEGITIDQTNGNVGFTGITSPDESIHTGGRVHLGQTTAPSTVTDKLYNVGGSLFWNGAQLATGGTAGDSLQVNGTAITTTGNLVNTTATGTVPAVTWTLTPGSPDQFNIGSIGAASATAAGVLTTGVQTIAGNKTLDGVLAIDTDTGNQRTNITRLGATDETLQIWTDDSDANFLSDQDENSGSTGNMRFMIDDDGTSTSYFHFETKSGTDLLRMNRNGLIGIGTAGPTATLDVNSGIALTPAAGASSRVLNLGGTISEAGSGNHVLLAGMEIAPPTITGAAATVSDTASLYVSNAPTATVSGANHALWVDAGKTRLDGDLDVGGAVTYTGTKPRRTIILTAGGALAGPSSTFADQQRTDGTNLSYFTLNFDATSDEKAFWEFVVPDSYTGSTAEVTLYWLYTGSNCSGGNCEAQWNVEMDGKAAGATLDSALQTAAVNTATGGNAGILNATSTLSVTTGWAPGEMAVVKVSRDADHASDDLGADAKLVHVKIEWDAASESD